MDQSNRGSGRTSRMLSTAIEAAMEGGAVYVVCLDKNQVRELEARADKCSPEAALLIKFETWDSLGNLDPHTMQLKRAHPNCKVFVDHAAIEDRYGRLLEELHRYDA